MATSGSFNYSLHCGCTVRLSYRSPNFFNMTIIGEDGKDASGRLKVMHYYHDPDGRKRSTSRLIDFCPSPLVSVLSTCRRSASAQAYTVWCQSPQGIATFHLGSCHDNEICVKGLTGANAYSAYCVSTENFVHIAQVELERTGIQPAEVGQRVAGSVAGEAVVTAPDGKTLVRVNGTIELDPVPPGTMEVHSQIAIQGIGAGLLDLLVVGAASAG